MSGIRAAGAPMDPDYLDAGPRPNSRLSLCESSVIETRHSVFQLFRRANAPFVE
ncbi:hypothetical protein DSM3645_23336 [Blastopirellula marina DSM 3645]|uniref:Uncharacterized protein n=1 Tax=Blastopirellula marina DSM 3645 TaxID=314230 RepID=A3ZQA4_9BACT|nr:hypothetical protein DSM3645_23336 [Blastopirellula marina DSM 3645]